jgi:hypothetical protein
VNLLHQKAWLGRAIYDRSRLQGSPDTASARQGPEPNLGLGETRRSVKPEAGRPSSAQRPVAPPLPCRPLSGTRLNNNTPGISGRLLT